MCYAYLHFLLSFYLGDFRNWNGCNGFFVV